jgi:hypothetical protein
MFRSRMSRILRTGGFWRLRLFTLSELFQFGVFGKGVVGIEAGEEKAPIPLQEPGPEEIHLQKSERGTEECIPQTIFPPLALHFPGGQRGVTVRPNQEIAEGTVGLMD